MGHGGRVGQRSPDMGPNDLFYNPPQLLHRAHISAAAAARNVMQGFASRIRGPRGVPPPLGGFQMPHLDYSAQAPGIFRENTPPADAAALRNADYKKPPPAKSGFTRSPKDTDFLVCANCDQELGIETTDDSKVGEVWTGKCGHVGFSM